MIIQTRQEFDAAMTVLHDASWMVVDTETFPIQIGKPTIQLGTAFYAPVEGREGFTMKYYFPWRHQHNPSLFPSENLPMEWMREFVTLFSRKNCTYIFHNAKFDVQVLENDGADFKGTKIRDTMLMSHMSNENIPNKLKVVTRILKLDTSADTEKKQIDAIAKNLGNGVWEDGWALIPPDVMGKYALKDVDLTKKLYDYLLKDIKTQEMDHLLDKEIEFMHFLRKMEQRGVKINAPRARELSEVCKVRMREIRSELGLDPMKDAQVAQRLFGAPPTGLGFQPREFGKKTKTFPSGRPVMDKHVLQGMGHPVADMIAEYRGYVKADSTWFEGFLSKTHADGKVRADYWQHGTVTTRLSCRNPNMQQLPREGTPDDEDAPIKEQVKSILDVEEGKGLWELDYSQMEFRLAACYSKEPAIINAYLSGSDMHQATADTVGVDRYFAKTLNFALLYGAQYKKIARMLGIPEGEAEEMVAKFWEGYPLLAETSEAAYNAVQEKGFLRLWTGRRRHIRYRDEYHKAFNSLLQGGGAEIVKDSCLKMEEAGLGDLVVAQVHDSLWLEVPDDDSEVILKQAAKVMEWPSEVFPIPFPVDMKRLA